MDTLPKFDYDIEFLAYKFYKPLRRKIAQLEIDIDNLMSERDAAQKQTEAERLRYTVKIQELYKEYQQVLASELLYAKKRSRDHIHSTKPGSTPVIVADLHGTLTSSEGFMNPGLPGAMLPPFPNVKEVLDQWASEGCCIHISTASLHAYLDEPTYRSREMLISEWVSFYNLPVQFWTGKVSAHTYYDDRMTEVLGPKSWEGAVAAGVQKQLDYRTRKNKAGIRELFKVPGYGDPIKNYPDLDEVISDHTRGFSTPILDVDFHCCLLKSNASDRTSDLMPGALDAIRKIYNDGYRIHLSCAGWDPLVHEDSEWRATLAGLRKLARELGVPYDQIVSKEHGVAFIDNYGMTFDSWRSDLPGLIKRLSSPAAHDEVTSKVIAQVIQ